MMGFDDFSPDFTHSPFGAGRAQTAFRCPCRWRLRGQRWLMALLASLIPCLLQATPQTHIAPVALIKLPDPTLALDLRLPADAPVQEYRPPHSSGLGQPDSPKPGTERALSGADDDSNDDNEHPLARAFNSKGSAPPSALCVAPEGDSPGAGIRWSLNDGVGFYVQGKAFRRIKRLMTSREAGLCSSGDNSALCEDLPLPTRFCQ